MLGLLFLASVFFNGYLLINKFLPKIPKAHFAAYFLTGSFISVIVIFISLFLLKNFFYAVLIYFLLTLLFVAFNSSLLFVKFINFRAEPSHFFELIVLYMIFIVFERSFSYQNNTFLIQSNLYQDLGAHIPYIRYFSQGNYYPEAPFFAGGKVLYHFMFDFYAAILEFLDLRIDIAINLLSSLSLISLFLVIIDFSKVILKSLWSGIVACLLFLLGTDLSFIQTFTKNGLSQNGLIMAYHNNTYVAGDLWGLTTNNFLNINTYLNQRHLIFGLLVFLYFFLVFLYDKKGRLVKNELFFLIIIITVLPFWHISILISIYLMLAGLYLFFPIMRRKITIITLFSLVLVLPQIYLIHKQSINTILLRPGFLIWNNLSIKNFILFWGWNLGFSISLVVFSFFHLNTFLKKIFAASLFLFVIPNIFQISSDMFDNHKFFNAWMMYVSIFASWGLIFLWKKKNARLTAIILFFLLTLSGVLSLSVVKNDVYAKIADASKSKLFIWIKQNTNRNSIFLTNGEIYDPVSISGRRTFLGRLHYAYLYGVDVTQRMNDEKTIFEGRNNNKIRLILLENKIDYIIIYKERVSPNLYHANQDYFKKYLDKIYEDNQANIYKV